VTTERQRAEWWEDGWGRGLMLDMGNGNEKRSNVALRRLGLAYSRSDLLANVGWGQSGRWRAYGRPRPSAGGRQKLPGRGWG
jgi:hypothetical protein